MPEYIDREAVYKRACRGCTRHGDEFGSCYHEELCEELQSEFASAPIADVEPVRHGRWEGEGDGYAETDYGEMALVYDVWSCSECGHIIDDGTDDPELLPNYCPNCGAKMEGDEDDG